MNTRSITIQKERHTEERITRSAEKTQAFAKHLTNTLHGGDVLALSGELGAGKTTFVQGLAKALGIKEQITSPTFVLMKVYQIKKPFNDIAQLCHIDAYRLDSSDELAAIGAGEYIGDAKTLTVIEWPERVSGLIPKSAIKLSFLYHVKKKDGSYKRFIVRTSRKKANVSEKVNALVYGVNKKIG